MKAPSIKPVRCAIYTRVSTDHGLDQEFNSLDAQYEAASAYIKSQAHAGWALIRSRYDDGGYSGAGLQLEQNNTRRNWLICGGLSTALPFPCKNSDLRKLTSRHFIVVGAVACSSWP